MISEQLAEFFESLSFRGNKNLRPAGTAIQYTEDMLSEYIKCSKDPIYFIENYVKVIHPDRGLVLMKLHDYQKDMILTYHDNRLSIGLTSRQMGKTTTAAVYFVWYIIFNSNKSVGVLANKQAASDEIMSRVSLAYENLPLWLQQGVKTWNKRSIDLENGSKIFSGPTTKSGVRGRTLNILYVDEIAFVQNNQAEEFFTAVYPTITASKESKVIMTSTPNGFNHFYKFWNEAEKGINGFVPIKCLWYQMPGRTQEWYEQQKAVLGELKTAQELDCSFLGSSMQLLTPATMNKLQYEIPLKEYDGDYKGLSVYENPKEGSSYVMSIDVSRGRHLDYSAFWVVDITQFPFKQVAAYNNNEVAPLMYTNIIHKIAKSYNEAYCLIEINDIGGQVSESLYYDFEYENQFWTKSGDNLGHKGADNYPGIRTTKKTKRIGCANFKDLLDKDQLKLVDYKTISQLSTFVQSTTGSYEADEGFNDDLCMAGVLFSWLASQPWFKDLTDQDARQKMYADKIREMEEDMMFGYYSDGGNEQSEEELSLELLGNMTRELA